MPTKGQKPLQRKSFKKKRTHHISGKLRKPVCQLGQIRISGETRERRETISPTMALEYNGHFFEALVDSGATRSLITVELVRKLEVEQNQIGDCGILLEDINKKPIEVVGEVILELNFGDKKLKQSFIIVNGISDSCLIGADAIIRHGIIINGALLKVYMEEPNENLRTQNRVKIAGKSSAILKVQQEKGIYEADSLVGIESIFPDKRIKIWNGINTVNGKKEILLRIYNYGSNEIQIEKDTIIARIGMVEITNKLETAKRIDAMNSDEPKNELRNDIKKIIEEEKLTEIEKEKLNELLNEFIEIFAKSKMDIGFTGIVQHTIDTQNNAPIKQKPYRIPYALEGIAMKEVEDLLQKEIISPSSSPWTSPVVLVEKKNGDYRFCIDYRKLNGVTKKDAYPIPNINEVLDKLNSNKYFTTLDLAAGYWQIAIADKDREKTAFQIKDNLYEFNRLPFGLSNAPATFQRFMNYTLRGLHGQTCLIYLDDVIILGNTLDAHVENIRKVFERLKATGVTLRLKKCQFLQKEVQFLGHLVSENGIEPYPGNTIKVKQFPTPTNTKEVKSFLGLASYYRKFIKNFASIAHPLTSLTKNDATFVWNKEQEETFQMLKEKLTKAPILSYPDMGKEFILFTDASDYGIGAVLSQIINDNEKVISYYSRHLTKSEITYSTTEKECLAIYSAVKHYRTYLLGKKFTLIVDHRPLEFLRTVKDNNRRINRWSLELAGYDYTIKYRSGKTHQNADTLSRIPICRATENYKGIKHFQQEDQLCQEITQYLTNKILEEPTKTPFWLKDIDKFVINKDGILIRRMEPLNDKCRNVITENPLIPVKLRKEITSAYHDEPLAGHLGFAKTYRKIRDRYYWPFMSKDIKQYCKNCIPCNLRKNPNPPRRIPLKPMPTTTGRFERIAMDIMGPLRETTRGYNHILVMTDYFTRWIEAVPLKNTTAQTIAEAFVDNFICRFGTPETLLTDRGSNFISHLFSNVCKILRIKRELTSPYHPQTDGLVERFNKTFAQIMSHYIDEYHSDWDLWIQKAVFAYNTSVQESTLETPFYLMYLQDPKFPLEIILNNCEKTYLHPSDYKSNLLKRLKIAHELAQLNTKKAKIKQKDQYDKRAKEGRYEIGDQVYLHNPAIKTGLTRKFTKQWIGPFRITDQLSNELYEIKNQLEKESRIIHFNRLKPYVDDQPWDDNKETVEITSTAPQHDENNEQMDNFTADWQDKSVHFTEPDEIIPADINNTDITITENQPTTDIDRPILREGLRNRRNIKPPEKLDL